MNNTKQNFILFCLAREIAFVRQLGQVDPNFVYYYLGFYIHSCPKMFYKGQYKPSFLLCPETYTFLPFAEAVLKLDRNKYSRLLENVDSSEEKNVLSKVSHCSFQITDYYSS
jgi:arginine-tRNA-protein transferase